MKFKDLKLKFKDIKAEKGEATIVFATLGVIDKDGDVIEKGAFGNGQEAAIVPAHNWASVPLGKARIFEEGNEAIAELKFNMGIQDGRDWFKALQFDLENGTPVQEFSFGFTVKEAGEGVVDDQHVRMIKEVEVHEVSPVLRGAGQNTRTLAVKSGLKIDDDNLTHDHSSGIKLQDQAAMALASLKELVRRVKSLADLRAKDGRGLSDGLKEKLRTCEADLVDLKSALSDLTAEPKPNTEDVSAEVTKAFADFQRTQATIDGNL